MVNNDRLLLFARSACEMVHVGTQHLRPEQYTSQTKISDTV
jgi:hypothetical protein